MSFVFAVAAVIVKDGKVLGMRRSPDRDAGAGLWETVSGRVEPGESPFQAIGREITEETGLEVRIDPRPIDAYTAERGEAPMVVVVYRAEHAYGRVRRSDEHDDHGWFTPAEFRERSTLSQLADAIDFAFLTGRATSSDECELELSRIVHALGAGTGTNAELDRQVTSILARSSFPPDDPPVYFSYGLRRAAAGETFSWIQVPAGTEGLGWAMEDLVELIPGSWYAADEKRDTLAMPRQRRALVVERSEDAERFAVVELEQGRVAEPAERTEPLIFATSSPTDEQILLWAYDPSVRLVPCDEEMMLDHERGLTLKLRLARDARCPKRYQICASFVHAVSRDLLHRPAYGIEVAQRIAGRLSTNADTYISDVGQRIQRAHDYALGGGPVSDGEAFEMARFLLQSGGLATNWTTKTIDGWKLFIQGSRALWIHRASGALAYRMNTELADESPPRELRTDEARTALLEELG